MEQLLTILRQLGVDNTIWIQLGFFLICYFFLSQFLFKPYMANLEFRKKKTMGSAEEATKLNSATDRLAMDYQGQVKSQNEKATTIYDKLKAQGAAEEEKLVGSAREEAGVLIEKTKKQIATDIAAAKDSLKQQIPQLARQIASRVLGRELS